MTVYCKAIDCKHNSAWECTRVCAFIDADTRCDSYLFSPQNTVSGGNFKDFSDEEIQIGLKALADADKEQSE